jgi:alpha-L-rhamnosidase
MAHFMGALRRDDGKNRWFLFRRVVHLDSVPAEAPTRITVDGRYQLFVNEARVARGPVRCSPLDQKYDEVDIAPHLRRGANVIGAIIHVFGQDKSWYEAVQGLWQPSFGDGAFWLDSPVVSTDLDWRCIQCDAWDQTTPEANHGLPNIENFDAQRFPSDWLAPNFNDSGWDKVHILATGGGGPEAPFGGLKTTPFPHLLPSGIPPLVEEFVAPEILIWKKGVICQPNLPITKRAYEEELTGDPADPRANGIAMLFRFDRLQTGYPCFELNAAGGEEIEIAVSEQVPGEWEDGFDPATARITRKPMLGNDAHVCRYIARPGKQRFERFSWAAVRWMQVTVRGAKPNFEFDKIGLVQTHYPVTEVGSFTSSDPLLNQLWSTGAYTLKLCMHDGWEDCPSREQRQWLGDATVEQLVGQVAFGPSVNALNAKYLKDAAASQRPDGLTQMFAPGNHGTNGLLIPDWTLQWILNARNHLLWSGDLDTIEAIFPNIERALTWFERSRGASDLVANMAYWHFMDWAGVGRDGEACTLNAQLAGCLTAAADMADSLDRSRVAAHYRHSAIAIRKALNDRHWDAVRGIYVDCVDPDSGRQGRRTSQHANAAMILWGGAPKDRWADMVGRMTDPSRLTFTAAPPIANTGATLNEEEGVVQANTFYSHFVYEALIKAGRADIAVGQMKSHYGPMLARGATTLWESFEPTASLCHGFSAAPTYHLVTGVLGLSPSEDGFSRLDIAPQPAGIEYIKADLATIHGQISAEFRKTDGGFGLMVTLPRGLPHHIICPAGYALQQERRTGSELHLTFSVAQ